MHPTPIYIPLGDQRKDLSSDLDKAVKSILSAVDGYDAITVLNALKIAPIAYEHAAFIRQTEAVKKMFGNPEGQTTPSSENALSPEELEKIIKVTDRDTPAVQMPEDFPFKETYGA